MQSKVVSIKMRLELYGDLLKLAADDGIENISTFIRSVTIKELNNRKKLNKISKVKNKAVEFEKQYGSADLAKISFSALNKLLVKKGLITKEELQHCFVKEIERFI